MDSKEKEIEKKHVALVRELQQVQKLLNAARTLERVGIEIKQIIALERQTRICKIELLQFELDYIYTEKNLRGK